MANPCHLACQKNCRGIVCDCTKARIAELEAEVAELRNDPDAGKCCGCRWVKGRRTVTCQSHSEMEAERDALRQALGELVRLKRIKYWVDSRALPRTVEQETEIQRRKDEYGAMKWPAWKAAFALIPEEVQP